MEKRFADISAAVQQQNSDTNSLNAETKAEMEGMTIRTMDMVAQLQDTVSAAAVQAAKDRASQAGINSEVKGMLLALMAKLDVAVPAAVPSATAGELSVDASVYPDNAAVADDNASDLPHGYQLVTNHTNGRTIIPGPYNN